MINFRNHPFAVTAFFNRSTVLTFAVPKSELEGMIPSCFNLDTLHDTLAFIAVALVDTKELRPKGFPRFLGNKFFLIGYRIFVTYKNKQGKRLRGLFIIRSETNVKRMEYLGNFFTSYAYRTIDIDTREEQQNYYVHSSKGGLSLALARDKFATLPAHSPFENWKQARRFAGPLPFTFAYNEQKQQVTIVEGLRKNWMPTPLSVTTYTSSFLANLKLKNIQLASAFEVCDVPYTWKKGYTESWP